MRSYETYIFHQLSQKHDEPIHKYYIRLREQATKCGFTDIDKSIKQQIKLSTVNSKLRRFSFRNPRKTFQELLTEGKTLEDGSIQSETLDRAQKEDVNAVNKSQYPGKQNFKLRGMSTSEPPKRCFRCDGIYPHQGNCPAFGKTCKKCGITGHFARCCKTNQPYQSDNKVVLRGRQNRNQNRYQKPLNSIAHSPQDLYYKDTSDSTDDDEYLFAIRDMYDVGSETRSIRKQKQTKL